MPSSVSCFSSKRRRSNCFSNPDRSSGGEPFSNRSPSFSISSSILSICRKIVSALACFCCCSLWSIWFEYNRAALSPTWEAREPRARRHVRRPGVRHGWHVASRNRGEGMRKRFRARVGCKGRPSVALVPPAARFPSPLQISSRIRLLVCATGVIHVMTAQSAAPRRTIMKTFTIDSENNITRVRHRRGGRRCDPTPFDTFASQQELAELAVAWPAERLVAIWNSLPGVKPVKGFKSANAAVSRIWERIQGLGSPPRPRRNPRSRRPTRRPRVAHRRPRARPPRPRQPRRPPPPRTRPRPKRPPRRGKRRAARGQQDSPGGRHAPAQERRHAGRDHGKDGMAKAHRPRLHGRHDEEGRIHRRVLQTEREANARTDYVVHHITYIGLNRFAVFR